MRNRFIIIVLAALVGVGVIGAQHARAASIFPDPPCGTNEVCTASTQIAGCTDWTDASCTARYYQAALEDWTNYLRLYYGDIIDRLRADIRWWKVRYRRATSTLAHARHIIRRQRAIIHRLEATR